MNELLTYTVMLDTLILAYPQFLIMLVELQKVLSQELSCFCNKTTTVLSVWTVAYWGGGWGVQPPPEILMALQNRAKLNPIVKTVKNCWI